MADLEWHLRGSQDFRVNFSRLMESGETLTAAEVELQRRTSKNPETWVEVTTVTILSVTVVPDAFTGIAEQAVYFALARDEDGDPAPEDGPYRFWVRAVKDTGRDEILKPTVELVP